MHNFKIKMKFIYEKVPQIQPILDLPILKKQETQYRVGYDSCPELYTGESLRALHQDIPQELFDNFVGSGLPFPVAKTIYYNTKDSQSDISNSRESEKNSNEESSLFVVIPLENSVYNSSKNIQEQEEKSKVELPHRK